MVKSGLVTFLILLLHVGTLAKDAPKSTSASNPQTQSHLARLTSSFAAVSQPTQAQIDQAANEAQRQGRIITITPGGMTIPTALQEVTSLPVTFRSIIGNWNYDITVLSMSFTPTGSVLSIGCRFYLPGSTNTTSLYFGANEIAVSGKSGFSGDLPILESLLSDAKSSELDDPAGKLGGQTKFFEFPLPAFQGKAWMGLGKDTKLSFSCGEFNKFSLSGFLKVYDLMEREDPAGQSLTDGKPLQFTWGSQDVFDWQDIYFPVTASRGFHSANASDIGFHPTDKTNVILDLSSYQSPASLPDCGGGSLGDSWQGLQFDAFAIRLPKLFKLRNPHMLMGQGTNLFLSPSGVIGTVTAQKVFALEEGYTDEINKFDLSLDQVTANFSCGASASISMSGRFRLGTCGTNSDKATELYYSVVYTEQDRRYQALVKESATDRFKNNGLTLSTGSTLSLSIQNESFVFRTALAAKPRLSTPAYHNSVCLNYPTTLTVSNCESITRNWSMGEVDKNTVMISPQTTTTYQVKCVDKYCISEASDELAITVYPSLPQPTLTATSLAFCTYQNASVNADNCVGKLEWQTPDNNTFRELNTNQQTAYFPEQSATATFSYQVRCNLNTCLSPEKLLSLTVYPEPKAPSLWSSATNNTIDRNNTVTLSGSCPDNNNIVWDNLPQATVQLTSSATYSAYCKNMGTGCQTQSHSNIGINVLYFPPAGPSPVTFSAVGTNYITVNWHDNSDNEDGFWVDRDTSPAFSNPIRVGDVGANTTSFVNYNLPEGVTYYYRIISHNRYDYGYSEVASRTTGVTPSNPILTASSTSIERGSSSNVSGYCPMGTLIWITPSAFSGGSYTQSEKTTYTAKCSSGGIESGESYLTVTVVDKPVVFPCSAPGKPVVYLNGQGQDVTITKGQSVQVSASCPPGSSVMWTQGTDRNGSNLSPTGNTYYAAKCKNDNDECSSEEAGRVVWVKDKPDQPQPGCTPPSRPIVYLNGQNQDIDIKKGEPVQVSASCPAGSRVVWTQGTDGTGSNLSPTGDTYYAARCKQDECLSEESGRVVWVKDKLDHPQPDCNPPGKPTVYLNGQNQDITLTKGEPVQVSASCPPGSNVVWTQGTDGNGSNLSPTGNTYYAAKCKNDNDECSSEEAGRVVWVKDKPGCTPPSKPVVYLNGQNQDVTITKGQSIQVSASCLPGSSVVWTDGKGSNLSPTGNTYYAAKCKNDNDECSSEEAGRVVWVKDKPGCTPPGKPTLSATSTSINKYEVVKLSASSCASGMTLDWDDDDNSQVERILTPAQTTTYRVRCWQTSTCYSDWTEVTVTVNEAPKPCLLPAPSIDGPNQVEKGKLLALVATGCDDCGIKWSEYTRWIWPAGQPVPHPVWNAIYTSIQDDKTFTASFTRDGCEGPTATKTVTVPKEPAPSFPPNSPSIAVTKTMICPNQGESSQLTVNNCNGTLSWSTGESANSITVYEAKTYTAYCATSGYSAVSTGQTIKSAAPTIDKIDRFGNTFTAYSSGCTTGISWYREGGGYSGTKVKDGDSININQYGLGRYEARCNNNCGSVSKTEYASGY